jgi:hypothetical protein
VLYAIELVPDEHADHQIRQIWTTLEEAGNASLGSIPNPNHQPHVSLSVFDHGNPFRDVAISRSAIALCSAGADSVYVGLTFAVVVVALRDGASPVSIVVLLGAGMAAVAGLSTASSGLRHL